jgi:hypothetical protein
VKCDLHINILTLVHILEAILSFGAYWKNFLAGLNDCK